MVNNYDLAGMGIYPYNSASMPYVSWEALSRSREQSYPTDIIVSDNEYIMRINLAGYDKDKIKVKTNRDGLIVTAGATHDISRELKVVTREIQFGDFRRVYSLNNIDNKSISAKFDNGILTITLPMTHPCEDCDQRDIICE